MEMSAATLLTLRNWLPVAVPFPTVKLEEGLVFPIPTLPVDWYNTLLDKEVAVFQRGI